jgi:NAD(P)-dependent dehydrogenase (short-subunit alcohol dehydrogenase family)
VVASLLHITFEIFLVTIVRMASKTFAVIAGVGPGTGAALVRRFAQAYPVVLLARSKESLEPLVEEVKASGGSALGIATDVSVQSSIQAAFEEIRATLGRDAGCAVCVFSTLVP